MHTQKGRISVDMKLIPFRFPIPMTHTSISRTNSEWFRKESEMAYQFSERARQAGVDEKNVDLFSRVVPAMWRGGVVTANIARSRFDDGTIYEIDGIKKEAVVEDGAQVIKDNEAASFVRNAVFGPDSTLVDTMFPHVNVIRDHLGSPKKPSGSSQKSNTN